MNIPIETLREIIEHHGVGPEPLAGIMRDLELWQKAQALSPPGIVPWPYPVATPVRPWWQEPPAIYTDPGPPIRSTTGVPLPEPEYHHA